MTFIWRALTWQALWRSDIDSEIAVLRRSTFQFLLWAAAGGYLAWHWISMVLVLPEESASYWLLFAIAVGSVLITYAIYQRHLRLAYWSFLACSLLVITATVWLLRTPVALLFYPLVALIAVVLLHPLAGLLVSASAQLILYTLWFAGTLRFLNFERLWEVGIASCLTTAIAWTLGRDMVIAVDWALQAYDQALRNAQDARDHRAKLVRALKQLDDAHYRLERANAALQLAWKAAEAAEQSRAEFVTNISHELRTPLNLIIGFSEMMLTSPECYGEPLPASYRGDLNAVYRSARHLLTLTNDVLDLARVGAGRLVLTREPVAIAQVINDACDIVREYVGAKGLWLRTEIQPDLPLLTLDRLRIRQVLLNLLTNAARFTEHGGITVTACQEGEWVRVSVSDTGCGIPPDQLPKVFQEFHHSEAGEEHAPDQFTGFGLGLPLSKRLVELHGGQMGVESVLGAGTTFWFILPTISLDRVAIAAGAEAVRPPAPAGASERIVILAGRDRGIVSVLRRYLQGYRLIGTTTLRKAIAAATEFRATAILTDFAPLNDDTARRSPVPIIYLPLPDRERMASALGVAGYLVKPVTRADLQATLTQLNRPVHRILIVDDDPRFVRLLTRMLQASCPGHQYEVCCAYTARESITAMQNYQPDVVLLDLKLPDLSGSEVIASMTADPSLAHIPVIVITAQDYIESDIRLSGTLSVTRTDGFRLEELLNAVETLLGALEPPRQYLTSPVK